MKIICKRDSFTLIELITVIVTISILASFGVTQYKKAVEKARKAEATSMMELIRKAEIIYHAENGFFTSDFNALEKNTGIRLPSESKHFTYKVNNPSNPDAAEIIATSKTGGRNYKMKIKPSKVESF